MLCWERVNKSFIFFLLFFDFSLLLVVDNDAFSDLVTEFFYIFLILFSQIVFFKVKFFI